MNLGKNKDTPLERALDDYRSALRAVYRVADYAVINVSSPNTPGLRDLQTRGHLAALMEGMALERASLVASHGRRVPLLVKIAPELTEPEQQDVVEAAVATGMDGLIATNTTTSRAGLHSANAKETGGLSGRPLRPRSLAAVHALYGMAAGRLPIIGVGGIFSAEDAYALIRAGASLVQVYTGLVYEGPSLVNRITAGLAGLLKRDSHGSIAQAVGAAHRKTGG